jgi:hypothetical protein
LGAGTLENRIGSKIEEPLWDQQHCRTLSLKHRGDLGFAFSKLSLLGSQDLKESKVRRAVKIAFVFSFSRIWNTAQSEPSFFSGSPQKLEHCKMQRSDTAKISEIVLRCICCLDFM